MKILVSLAVTGLLVLSATAQNTETTTTTTTTNYELCSAIHGAHFRTSDSGDAGTIEDLLIDPREGRIVTIVTSVDNKLIPVPWADVTVGDDLRTISVNTTRERLIAAPTIERTQIAHFNPELFRRSDTFFRENRGGHPGPNTAERRGMSPDGQNRDMNQNERDRQGVNSAQAGSSPTNNANEQGPGKNQPNSRTAERNRDQHHQAHTTSGTNSNTGGRTANNENGGQAGGKRHNQHGSEAASSPSSVTSGSEGNASERTNKRSKTESKSSLPNSSKSAASPVERMPKTEKESSGSEHHESSTPRAPLDERETGPQ